MGNGAGRASSLGARSVVREGVSAGVSWSEASEAEASAGSSHTYPAPQAKGEVQSGRRRTYLVLGVVGEGLTGEAGWTRPGVPAERQVGG